MGIKAGEPVKVNPKQFGKVPVNVWLTTLNFAALPTLLFTFLTHGRFTLRFTARGFGNGLVATLLWWFRVLNSPAKHVRLTQRGIQVDDPETPWFNLNKIVNESTETFFSIHQNLLVRCPRPNSQISRNRILVNLRKIVANNNYQLVTFLEFVRDWHKSMEIPAGKLVIISTNAGLANAIPKGWAGENLKFLCPWSPGNSLVLHFGRNVIRHYAQSMRLRRNQPNGPLSIGIAISEGFDKSARLNDLFWWWGSGIPPEQLVLIFDRPDQPATREAVSLAEQHGIRCVVSDRRATGDSPHLLWTAAPGPVASGKRLWRTVKIWAWGLRRGSVARWIACRMLTDSQNSLRMEDLLNDFNVRGLLHHQDVDSDYISLACDAIGAVRFGYHWSDMYFPMAYHARLNHVYFCWGSRSAVLMEALGSRTDHVLLSGCVVNGAHPGVSRNEDVMRQRRILESNGASRIFALFDTSLPCDGFYDYFLRQVIEDDRWGLMIKPKGRATAPWFNEQKPDFISLYNQAEATGRVITIGHLISPAEVAGAADFSVAVGINSAATVAALAGNRAIHLDYARLHDSPFSDWAIYHKAGADQIVFSDPEKLWASINRYFDEPDREENLGLMDDNLIRYIDPFLDGNAGQRIGDYVRWYLEGLGRGLERGEALANSTNKYGEKWGQNSVVKAPASQSNLESNKLAEANLFLESHRVGAGRE